MTPTHYPPIPPPTQKGQISLELFVCPSIFPSPQPPFCAPQEFGFFVKKFTYSSPPGKKHNKKCIYFLFRFIVKKSTNSSPPPPLPPFCFRSGFFVKQIHLH